MSYPPLSLLSKDLNFVTYPIISATIPIIAVKLNVCNIGLLFVD